MTERTETDPAADERTTLRQFLDHYRDTLAMKIDGLTDEQARTAAVPPSDLNLLGLVRHMAEVERGWFRRTFAGEDAAPFWYGNAHPTGDPDGDMHAGPSDTVAEALAIWHGEIAYAQNAEAGCDSLDQLATRRRRPDDPLASMRWIMVHMIEEYARHCGHADLLRECIDGSTGY